MYLAWEDRGKEGLLVRCIPRGRGEERKEGVRCSLVPYRSQPS